MTCAHGTLWWFAVRGWCAGCAKAQADAIRQFDEAVKRGEYDQQGYTPAERQAQERRRSHGKGCR